MSQIATGEVAERPASVAKELIENSLHAGANRIGISAEQGGVKRSRARDPGSDIAVDYIPQNSGAFSVIASSSQPLAESETSSLASGTRR